MKVGRLACEVKMYFADQSGLLALMKLLLGCGESFHPYMFGILPHFKHWCLYVMLVFYTSFMCVAFSKKRHFHSCFLQHHSRSLFHPIIALHHLQCFLIS